MKVGRIMGGRASFSITEIKRITKRTKFICPFRNNQIHCKTYLRKYRKLWDLKEKIVISYIVILMV